MPDLIRHCLRVLVAGLTLASVLACDGLLGPPEIDPSLKPADDTDLIVRERRAPSKAQREIPIEDVKAVKEAVRKLPDEWGEVVEIQGRLRQPVCDGRPISLSMVGTQLIVSVPVKDKPPVRSVFDMIRGRENAGRVNLTVESAEGDAGPAAFRWIERAKGLGQWDLPGTRFQAMPLTKLPGEAPCPAVEPDQPDQPDEP